MNENNSQCFDSWVQLSDIEKIQEYIRYQGFIMIQDSSTNNIFVHNNIVISIRKLRLIKGEKK